MKKLSFAIFNWLHEKIHCEAEHSLDIIPSFTRLFGDGEEEELSRLNISRENRNYTKCICDESKKKSIPFRQLLLLTDSFTVFLPLFSLDKRARDSSVCAAEVNEGKHL